MLTSAQIINQVCQIAKSPGFTSQAGQLLNTLLSDLAQNHDFDILRKATTINVDGTAAAYALPGDYLRQREVFYTIDGEPFYLNQIPQEDYDQLYQGPGVANYPQSFATNLGNVPPGQPGYAPIIQFWPPPAMPIAMTLRYQSQPADITTPETSSSVPWFPNQRYLVKQLAADLMMFTDDLRLEAFGRDATAILRDYLTMDDDKEGYVRQVKLDARFFRGSGGSRATKQLPL